MQKSITYKSSGVDVKKANVFVDSIQGLVKATSVSGVLKRKGSFGSLFALDKTKFKNPVLVSSTDGVGTKLLLANLVNKHDTVGIDLVAMNVNDILCVGAKPLFFLDYIACGKLKPNVLKEVVKGIAAGCKEAGCALIGGETAEMPGMYKTDDYDLAGFAIGIVEKDRIIDGSRVQTGNVLIGLASNGLHSNGFSLVRKVFSTIEQKKLAGELLRPTRIYVKEVLDLLGRFDIKGIAHITGGAFYEKLTRIISEGKCAAIERESWPVPKIFQMIQKKGRIAESEIFRTLNMGIGLVLAVDRKVVSKVMSHLSRLRMKCWQIGSVVSDREKKIIFR